MDTLLVGLRAVLALACVLALIWYVSKRWGGATGGRRAGRQITLVARQALGGKSSVVLVDVADRRLLLGVGDQGVTLLTELPQPEPEADQETDPAGLLGSRSGSGSGTAGAASGSAAAFDGVLAREAGAHGLTGTPDQGPLANSILSGQTWKRALETLQTRSGRR